MKLQNIQRFSTKKFKEITSFASRTLATVVLYAIVALLLIINTQLPPLFSFVRFVFGKIFPKGSNKK